MRRLSEEERKEIVRGLLERKYCYIPPEDIPISAPFLKLYLNHLTDEDLKNVGMVLGVTDSIAPRLVNKKPMFFEVKLIHKEDAKLIAEEYNSKIKAIETIKQS